ncbi:dipeptide epimerase [Parasedimentitalea huanghaiensis]|uniref:Dipeptide epimerase n=1 Tax=Parasedimentitalea huanghaiensis TaxID=2682100 RepID=A0A6L6WLW7_9RHOB|nr:dipeptide epimerase [Zongyanglinia huanghaiensis]MVO17999.1 dipeptide epimerase [Zongyanglinia huanghaiensis]
MIRLDYKIEKWPLKDPFRFAGHTIVELEAMHVTLVDGEHRGQGEGLVPVVFPITMAETETLMKLAQQGINTGGDPQKICASMPAGPGRNALDCALWDLRAKQSGRSVWDLAGLNSEADFIEVDETVGLGQIPEMAAQAKSSAHRVIKVKLDAEHIPERVAAIRSDCPRTELIVDANQSWTVDLLMQHAPALAKLGVKMIEQPVPPEQDHLLEEISCGIPIFADESCHVAADVDRLKSLYDGVNVKLDKTGGLTEALALVTAARAAGMGVMVGCMSGTSLSMAPAFVIGSLADWSDLDGPLMIQNDRVPAMQYEHGKLKKFSPALWG